MIPKIIHFCWLSGDPFPQDIAKCLSSWKQVLADYELWLWGKKPIDCLGLNIIEKNFDVNSIPWTKQAFEQKKYAFAADYIRLLAVYQYGGIYLDSDVMMYKSFDDLLTLPYFLGEDAYHCFEPAIFGAERGNEWVSTVLSWYNNRLFTNPDGSSGQRGLPVVFHDTLTNNYRFALSELDSEYVYSSDVIRIFPSIYFNSRNFIKPIRKSNSYCSHFFVGSWLKKSKKKPILYLVKKGLPDFLLNWIYAAFYHLRLKQNMKDVLIPYIQNDGTQR